MSPSRGLVPVLSSALNVSPVLVFLRSVSQVAVEDTVQLLELEVTPTEYVPPEAEASTASVVSHRDAWD